MDIKRKVALAAATIVVALGSGYVLQSTSRVGPKRVALAQKPVAITPLAAGVGSAAPRPTVVTAATSPERRTLPGTEPEAEALKLPDTAFAPQIAPPAAPARTAEKQDEFDTAPTDATDMMLSGDSINCPISLNLTAAPKAMIDVTLLAPCNAGQRVVMRHGGLAVTGQTTLSGALFAVLPAMDEDAVVSILFPDGSEASEDINLPDLPIYRRIAVQWQDKDSFELHAFEDGAEFGASGHVSASNPHSRIAGIPSKNGFMTLLGDDSVSFPMMAAVYTYPIDFSVPVDISVEATVTAATCDRELLGELLLSEGGSHASTDLTLATPDCGAIGDVLVLNNPLPDLKLATAN
jgi:hypothetical protein